MGILYIVPTPIGNLEDITFRAIKILKEVDLIACEDTRHTKILLDHYQITTPTISYHQHSKIQKISFLINKLKDGKNVALVSDAGTPGINDPGGLLVQEAIKNDVQVIALPGAFAASVALSASGFPADRFLFVGFLPKKKGRQTMLRNLMKISQVDLYDLLVLYESPHRVLKTLQDLQLAIGNKDVVVGRELTKKFEEIKRGKIAEVITHFKNNNPKGEFVIIIRNN